ncbi:hypothetical protein RJ639_036544 [Escallonia herrerae]|uniref:J domain-containing protein n=1 Tax=Escallonia herrerae TaxID=1293975 RepID=A0AA88X1N9_9ASTE|nr:hypothetical protein RJ639_036544 [Escallonia herrerae]
MEQNTSRAEAERLLGIAEKLLQNKDLNGSRDFAVLAQETEPLLDGSDQILAVVDVLLAAEKRINNNHLDWYGILQLDRRTEDLEIVKKQYRRLALLLHPDKNKFPFADAAFKLVADSWAILSNQTRKSSYDVEVNMFTKVDLVAMKKQKDLQNQQQQQHDLFQQKLPVRRSSFAQPPPPQQQPAAAAATDGGGGGGARPPKFWTACPYCYNLYEYPRVYEDCCLRCQNCQRAFHASVIPALPPLVSGKDAYYCCWGFFPMGFAAEKSEAAKNAGFHNWIPPMYPTAGTGTAAAPVVPPVVEEVTPPPGMAAPNGGVAGAAVAAAPVQIVDRFANVSAGNATPPAAQTGPKKRGRPRKNPL